MLDLHLCSSWLSGTCAAKGPARSVPRMRAAAALAFLGPSHAFYLPGVAPIEYAEGARVELKVNKLTSVKTQLPYGYYTLPFCKPDSGIVESVENLGEILAGDLIENSPFDLRMGEDEKCKMLCKKPLEAADKEKFRLRIDDEYLVNFIVDNLPAATKYVRKSDGGEFTCWRLCRIQLKAPAEEIPPQMLLLDLRSITSEDGRESISGRPSPDGLPVSVRSCLQRNHAELEQVLCDWVAKFAATQDAWHHETEVAVPEEHGIALAQPLFGPRTDSMCTQDDEMPEDPEKESLPDEDSRWLGADFSTAPGPNWIGTSKTTAHLQMPQSWNKLAQRLKMKFVRRTENCSGVLPTAAKENSLDQMRKTVAAAKLSKKGSRESEHSSYSRSIWKQTNESTWSYLQAVSRVILRHRVFDAACGSIIILNAAFIGAQVEYEAVNPGEPELGWWLAGQAFF
eukprot:s1435_g6.t1